MEKTTGEIVVGQMLHKRTAKQVENGDVPDPLYYERVSVGYNSHKNGLEYWSENVFFCPKPFGKIICAVGRLAYLYARVLRRFHRWGFLDCEAAKSHLQAARHLRNWHLAFWKDRHCRWDTKFTERQKAFRDCNTCNLKAA